MHIHTHTCTHVYIHIHTHAHTHAHTRACTHIQVRMKVQRAREDKCKMLGAVSEKTKDQIIVSGGCGSAGAGMRVALFAELLWLQPWFTIQLLQKPTKPVRAFLPLLLPFCCASHTSTHPSRCSPDVLQACNPPSSPWSSPQHFSLCHICLHLN